MFLQEVHEQPLLGPPEKPGNNEIPNLLNTVISAQFCSLLIEEIKLCRLASQGLQIDALTRKHPFHQCIKQATSLSKYDQTNYHSSSINNNSQPFLLQFYRLLKIRSGRVRNYVIKLLYIYNKITNYFPTHQLYGIELYILASQLALSIHR